MKAFSARIFIISKINPVVDVPGEVLEYLFQKAGRRTGAMPVKGKLNGAKFTHNVVKYEGAWRLYLNGPMRAAAGIDTGDVAELEIGYDPAPRTEPIPELLEKALKKNKTARLEFETLSPSRQKEIKRYLNSMKTEESRARNVAKVIKHLTGEPTDKLHALMRVEKKG
jgi:Bacteriocin-protection, YdeI or OmpD-Associated/Domain of unknown function (DUF1905)